MKKSEIAIGLDLKATSIFITTSIALIVNSVVNNLLQSVDMPVVADNIGMAMVILFSIFSYITIVKGFSVVNKACKLSEKNENFYMGKKLTVFSVVCIILTTILSIVAMTMSVLLTQYSTLQEFTAADIQARDMLFAIVAVVNIAMQMFAVSTPFIFYLWKIYKITAKSEPSYNIALLAVIVLVVHLAIGILNSAYAIKGDNSAFLTGFSSILSTVKYLLLFVFFVVRRKGLLKKAETVQE